MITEFNNFLLTDFKRHQCEYVSMEGTCQCGCRCKGVFPKQATAPVSYGPNVHALVGYMSTLQSIPFKRMVGILNNVFGMQMSQGTVSNILQRMRKKKRRNSTG